MSDNALESVSAVNQAHMEEVDFRKAVDEAFSTGLASAIMSQFPVACIIAILQYNIAYFALRFCQPCQIDMLVNIPQREAYIILVESPLFVFSFTQRQPTSSICWRFKSKQAKLFPAVSFFAHKIPLGVIGVIHAMRRREHNVNMQ